MFLHPAPCLFYLVSLSVTSVNRPFPEKSQTKSYLKQELIRYSAKESKITEEEEEEEQKDLLTESDYRRNIKRVKNVLIQK